MDPMGFNNFPRKLFGDQLSLGCKPANRPLRWGALTSWHPPDAAHRCRVFHVRGDDLKPTVVERSSDVLKT